MNQTTKETRRRSYDAVLPKRAARCRLILETLGNRELTASEITEELVAAGRIPYFNRNYVAPRLTELKEIGILTTVGRRKATRSDATEAVWARAEPSGPTGQTAAAYADNPTETVMAECIAGAMKDTLEKYGTAGDKEKGATT